MEWLTWGSTVLLNLDTELFGFSALNQCFSTELSTTMEMFLYDDYGIHYPLGSKCASMTVEIQLSFNITLINLNINSNSHVYPAVYGPCKFWWPSDPTFFHTIRSMMLSEMMKWCWNYWSQTRVNWKDLKEDKEANGVYWLARLWEGNGFLWKTGKELQNLKSFRS